jgi:hypothetical protein
MVRPCASLSINLILLPAMCPYMFSA